MSGDAQNVCAVTIVGTVLNLKEFDSKIEYVLFKSEYLQLVEGLIQSSSPKIVLNRQ